MQPPASADNASATFDKLEVETFTIKPHESYRVDLGNFPEGTQPRFQVIYPESLESPNVVSYRDIVLHRDGDTYKLYRAFQNFDQVPRTITVRFATEADKALCCD